VIGVVIEVKLDEIEVESRVVIGDTSGTGVVIGVEVEPVVVIGWSWDWVVIGVEIGVNSTGVGGVIQVGCVEFESELVEVRVETESIVTVVSVVVAWVEEFEGFRNFACW
jgi:hypothetical protein